MFLSDLEDAENAPKHFKETSNMRYVTNPNEIKKMLKKRNKRKIEANK